MMRQPSARATFSSAASGLTATGCPTVRIIGRSDSESDLPMLRVVGHPVAVNPDSALEKVARAEGWRIMRFDRLAPLLKIGAATGCHCCRKNR